MMHTLYRIDSSAQFSSDRYQQQFSMGMQSLTWSACWLCLLSLLSNPLARGQRLPPNNCDNLFHYQRQGDHWIGHITPTQNGLKSVDWKLTFAAHGVNLVSLREREEEGGAG